MTNRPTQTFEDAPPRRPRLDRSELAVPSSNVKVLERSPTACADIVMLAFVSSESATAMPSPLLPPRPGTTSDRGPT